MRAAATSVICLVFMLSTAAAAADQPTRSVDDYICAFAGKCGTPQNEPEDSKEAPETRGFRLIRPTNGAAGNKAPAATGAGPGRQAVAAARQGPRPSSPVRSRRTAPAAAAAAAGRALAAAAERRADLRLSFETGSATLTPRAREEATIFGKSLLHPELAGKRFLIEGHTDSVGGRAYNLDLSQRRAEAVADYLAALGVDRGRLTPRGFGFARPLSGRSAHAPENRRVEALLIKN